LVQESSGNPLDCTQYQMACLKLLLSGNTTELIDRAQICDYLAG
jgi:DNA-binding CsgD family transcriptional regulator